METIDAGSQRPKRPVFLLVLCILSFVWLGFGLLTTVTSLAAGPSSAKEMKQEKANLDEQMEDLEAQGASDWKPTIEKFKTLIVTLNKKFYYVHTLSIFTFILGAIGVMYMFVGRKIGFHVYIIYSILATCHYYFFLSPASVPSILVIFSAFISALFIFLYSRNLKWMR
ncbi:MAG: hypothetical protein ACFHU9_01180 [Fluviicola sp.]